MKYYCEEKELVLKELSASDDGLRQAEAERRLEQDGKNRLAAAKGKSLFRRFLEQLVNPMIIVLLVAAAVNFVTVLIGRARGENESFAEFIIIIAVVLLNAVLGVVQSNTDTGLDFLSSLANGIGTSLGYFLVIFLFACIREKFEGTNMPKAMKGVPIALVTAALLALSFYGLQGII